MTNQFFYPEEDDMNPKKNSDADGDDDTDEIDETEKETEVDDDDLIDDGIEEGGEIE